MAEKPFLTELGYPLPLHDLFVIRRQNLAVTVFSTLIGQQKRDEDPSSLIRLSADCDFFRLPAKLRIEYIGCGTNVTPKFVRMDGQEWMIVQFVKSPAWFSWEGGCLIIPPGPEGLRESAGKFDATDPAKAAEYRLMADWIERIPISPVVDPTAPAPPMPPAPPPVVRPSAEETEAARKAASEASYEDWFRLVNS